jgi:hypothetical protein
MGEPNKGYEKYWIVGGQRNGSAQACKAPKTYTSVLEQDCKSWSEQKGRTWASTKTPILSKETP